MSEKQPQVLLVSPHGKPGGAERALANLARRLPAEGFAVRAAVLGDGPLVGWLEAAGCPTSVFEAGRLRQPVRATRTVAALRNLLQREPSIVVVSLMDKGHIYGGAAARTLGIPAVWWQQVLPMRSRFEALAARIPSAAVVCVSDEGLAAQRRLTPDRHVVKIENGVPVRELRSRRGAGAAIRAALGWESSPIVGIVARLQRWKGQEDFLRAAATVAKSFPEVRYLVVGGAILGWEGSYPDDLRRLAVELGLGDTVHFAGHQADSAAWLDALDVSVLASRDDVFPLVLLEAMALGKPVVATASGGPAQIVIDGESGLLVPPSDPTAMAGAISIVLADSQLASRLGDGAERRAAEFSDERMAESFGHLLTRIIRPDRKAETPATAGAVS
jgi:glycosyltransferase involved in cell wall biosynthesis